MGLIKNAVESFQHNARTIGLGALMMAGSLLGHAQTTPNKAPPAKKFQTTGKEMPARQQVGAAAIYADGTVEVDSANHIRWKYDSVNNHSVFVRYDERYQQDTVTKKVQMTPYFAKHVNDKRPNRWVGIEAMKVYAQGSESAGKKAMYRGGAYILNPRNQLYMAVGASASTSPYLAGPYIEYGATMENPFLDILPDKIMPERFTQYFPMSVRYRTYTQDPNTLKASFDLHSEWVNNHTEYKYIPPHGELEMGAETGPNSPVILGIGYGWDCHDFGANLLNFASNFTEVKGGLRLWNDALFSLEMIAYLRDEKFNRDFRYFTDPNVSSAEARGIQFRLSMRPGNIGKIFAGEKDRPAHARDGIATSVGYMVSNNPNHGGAFYDISLYAATPFAKDNDLTYIHLGAHNPGNNSGKHTKYYIVGLGIGTSPRSPIVLEAEGGINIFATDTEMPATVTPYAQFKLGKRFREDKTVSFSVNAVGLMQQFNDDPNKTMTFGNDLVMSAGVEGAMNIRFGVSKRQNALKNH